MIILTYLDNFFSKSDHRFRWVFCQLEALRSCYPQGLRRALDQLPETLDATYERMLLGIDKAKQGYAYHLFQCLAVSIRPLRVEELADILAVLLDTEEDSAYHVDWRPEDAQQAVLSTCSSLISVVNVGGSSVVQFSHFSVKEFLTSSRLADAGEHLSRFHILPHPAHVILARASLSALLNLGDQVTNNMIENHPFAIYAARYWVEHAKFGDVSSSIQDLMERLFDPGEPHFATWVWLYDIDRPWEGHTVTTRPMRPKASPLYYATLCGFRNLIEDLATTYPGDVRAIGGTYSTPLHAALAKRDIDTALVLLEHGADINSLDFEGRSPLHRASLSGSWSGYRDIVEFLLEHQAKVDIQEDQTFATPFHWATQNRDLEICQVLLEHGAALDKTNVNQETPLHVASLSGHLEMARFLIGQGANTTSKDKDGDIPLHNASRRGHLDLVEMFLESGLDINARNADEETPLDLASGGGHLEVVRFLIERGADVNCCDKRGWSPLHTAALNGHLSIVRLLLNPDIDDHVSSQTRDSPPMLASRGGHAEPRFLTAIEYQVDVNSIGDNGWTPLLSASRYGHADVVQLLLEHGADVNVQAADLWASLHLASAYGHLKVAELLVERGAEVDARSEDQQTPLDLASGSGNLEVAYLLIKSGSNVNSQNTQGWTPSHSAAQNGHLDVVKLLLDSGADVDMRDRRDKTAFDISLEHGRSDVGNFLAKNKGGLGSPLGDSVGSTSLEAESQNSLPKTEIVEPQPSWGDPSHDEETADEESTSLHSALASGRIGMIKRLLDRGADVDERDELLQTPLDVASKEGKLEIATTLIKYGADVNSRDTIGWTPLHTAARYGHIDVVRLLLDNGADMNTVQRNYQTPLHMASINCYLEVVQLLLERGANVQLRNAYGRTPSQEALTKGHGKIAQLLSKYGS